MSFGAKVIVWDSDGLNPYGAEIAACIAERWPTALLIARDAEAIAGRAQVRRVLAPGRNATKLGRLVETPILIYVLAAALLRGNPVLVVWARTGHVIMHAVFGRLGGRLAVVVHNPGSSRDSLGWRSAVTSWALRGAHIVAHSEGLLSSIQVESRSKRVIQHLPYRQWCLRHELWDRSDRMRGDSVLLLGALRPDKGSHLVPELVARLVTEGRGKVVVAAWPRLRLRDLPAGAEQRLVDLSQDEPLDDELIAEALRVSDVLVAPYVEATESGTVVLAISSGLDVIAFDSGALRTGLDREALVGNRTVDGLLTRLNEWKDRRWCTASWRPQDRYDDCQDKWFGLVTDLTNGRPSA